MSKLTMKNVNKTYNNGYQAVNNFNIDTDDKEFIILVGPSGCGKTTTLRMIAGLEEITAGEIFIGDRLVNNVEPKDRNISMVFQNYALYPHMTVYDNIAFSLQIRRVPKKETDEQVRRVAKILELDRLLDRKPKQLSGGQKQRVAIGSSIIRHPKLLLMDEPLSNLDAKLRSQMRVELLKLYKGLDSTIVYVTHDQTEAMTLGTKIVVMNNGEIQQTGTPSEIYDNPANVFVAGFIGLHSTNFADADVVYADGEVLLKFFGNSLKASKNQEEILKSRNYIGRKITLGIRPEYFCEYEYNKDWGNNFGTMDAVVELREFLGAESLIYFNLPGSPSLFCARVSTELKAAKGDKVKLSVNMGKVKLFDSGTKEDIMRRGRQE